MRAYVADELRTLKSTFGDRRRTQIVDTARVRKAKGQLTAGDLLEDKDTWVVVTEGGLISRTPSARLPRLSGKDSPAIVVGARTSDVLYLMSADGRCAALAVHRLPESDDPAKGASAGGATPLPPGVRPVAAVALPAAIPDNAPGALLLTTSQGAVKRIPLNALPGPSARTFTIFKLATGDSLGWARMTFGEDEILLAGSGGNVIRFSEVEVRTVGLNAAGVMGMRLEKKERIVGMDLVRAGADLFVLTEGGMGKRVPLAQIPSQGRYGKGIRVFKSGTGLSGIGVGAEDDKVFAHLVRGATRSIAFSAAPRRSRAANGARLVEVKSKDRLTLVGVPVARVALVVAPPPKPTKKKGKGKGKVKKAAASRGRKPTKGSQKKARKPPAKKTPAKRKPAARQGAPKAPAAKKAKPRPPAAKKPAGSRAKAKKRSSR